MNVIKVLKSTYEPSTNFLGTYGKGVIEARYVRKEPSYIACYVSSHNGCKMGCKFCHLTQNNDTQMNHVDIPTYLSQIRTVLEHYKIQPTPKANRCNINFMSKGDAMANRHLVNNYPELYEEMDLLCEQYDLKVKPNISTIMPYTIKHRKLSDIFQTYPAYLYYSLYSLNPDFRKKWLPNAIPWQEALDKLKEFQESSNNIITFHWSLIKGENDNLEEVKKLADVLSSYKFHGKFNIVRFNPHPNVADEEPNQDVIDEVFKIVADVFKNPKSYQVPRLDVKTKTPCGMFVPLNEIEKDIKIE